MVANCCDAGDAASELRVGQVSGTETRRCKALSCGICPVTSVPQDDKAAATADALELLLINQTALRAAIEEVSTCIRQQGSVNIHDNVMTALQSLDINADAIASAIDRLSS